ncbi:isochorismatase family protein [Streptomyces platensis]|uniref:isochorismatase family protein n=1 Tax=Streptomyces platensis TaxID=58346 RepID=UPI00386D5F67
MSETVTGAGATTGAPGGSGASAGGSGRAFGARLMTPLLLGSLLNPLRGRRSDHRGLAGCGTHSPTLGGRHGGGGVTQIVLGGIATSIGVESTARAAYEHGYHVTLATDAMTDLDADAHRNSVERVFPRLGETGTTDAIRTLLR